MIFMAHGFSAQMPDGKATFTEHLLELSVAAVLITVPLFVIPYSAMPFEDAKVSLLRTVAVMCLPFSALALLRKKCDLNGRRGFGIQPILPLIIMVCFFALTQLMSSLFSVSPSQSFFGTQLRRQGIYTNFCYLFFFLCGDRNCSFPSADRTYAALSAAGRFPGLFLGHISISGL